MTPTTHPLVASYLEELDRLLAGIDPDASWTMLRLYEREVHPHLDHGKTEATQ